MKMKKKKMKKKIKAAWTFQQRGRLRASKISHQALVPSSDGHYRIKQQVHTASMSSGNVNTMMCRCATRWRWANGTAPRSNGRRSWPTTCSSSSACWIRTCVKRCSTRGKVGTRSSLRCLTSMACLRSARCIIAPVCRRSPLSHAYVVCLMCCLFAVLFVCCVVRFVTMIQKHKRKQEQPDQHRKRRRVIRIRRHNEALVLVMTQRTHRHL